MRRVMIPGLFLILVMYIINCYPENRPPKKYLLDRDQLISVLVDIQLYYSIQTTPGYYEIVHLYDTIDTHDYIFKKHGISKAAFDSTISFYSKNPENLIEIYDEVIMKLNQMQDSLKMKE